MPLEQAFHFRRRPLYIRVPLSSHRGPYPLLLKQDHNIEALRTEHLVFWKPVRLTWVD